MRDVPNLPDQILEQLDDVRELSPAEELTRYEQVLAQLTELLNAPEHDGVGSN